MEDSGDSGGGGGGEVREEDGGDTDSISDDSETAGPAIGHAFAGSIQA